MNRNLLIKNLRHAFRVRNISPEYRQKARTILRRVLAGRNQSDKIKSQKAAKLLSSFIALSSLDKMLY
ncbi:MAG: hypothetical protein GF364_04890 [Candidatus Lokiarchaeota archaeon]|nr:hypothetical protein [Candidatus Lokiarchaeota archaeon]